AYQRPPFYYRNTRSISVAFETNLEAALEALPEPLALSDPATAILSFYEYPWTTFGPYNEAILSLLVEHKGRPMNYIMHIAVTTEPPMLAGREISHKASGRSPCFPHLLRSRPCHISIKVPKSTTRTSGRHRVSLRLMVWTPARLYTAS